MKYKLSEYTVVTILHPFTINTGTNRQKKNIYKFQHFKNTLSIYNIEIRALV